ncbi:DUF982 domain-containing protein [Mesorhizobium sp. AR07]|nr:DUF982 domain-containing protein [Mesorhizobium sp. AR07]
MYESWFSKPVSVTNGLTGEIRNLSNATQAIDLLSNQWRDEGGRKYLLALRACRQATSGAISADVARNAVVAAARDAHMLVE